MPWTSWRMRVAIRLSSLDVIGGRGSALEGLQRRRRKRNTKHAVETKTVFLLRLLSFFCAFCVNYRRATGSALQPHLGRPRMGLQAFAVGEFGGDRAEYLGAGFADFDDAAALLEVVH